MCHACLVVRLYLVRHACAGRKDDWTGPDADRPLDPAGVQQAVALARELAAMPITRLMASPARRCRQTLEPLSREIGLEIRAATELSLESSVATVDDLTAAPFVDGAVLCTHGELLTKLLHDAKSKGAPIDAERASDDWILLKGSAWVTELGDGVPRIVHRVPLAVPDCPQHVPPRAHGSSPDGS